MKYSEFLKANDITNDNLVKLMGSDCQHSHQKEALRLLWGVAITKVNPPEWLIPELEKARKEIDPKEFPFLGAEDVFFDKVCDRNYPDSNALCLAICNSNKNNVERGEDCPEMEASYKEYCQTEMITDSQ